MNKHTKIKLQKIYFKKFHIIFVLFSYHLYYFNKNNAFKVCIDRIL